MLCLVPTVAMAANASENTTEFLGGTGEANNPYIISNKTHLSNVYKYPNAHFKLMSDIVDRLKKFFNFIFFVEI